MKIGDILLGRINHRYTHDMSANNSTSMDFGSVQPLYCTYLMKGSDVKINMRQLLRPAPMVSPTFGRVTEHTVTRFVPMSEIYPAFDALLSHRSIQGNSAYIPDSVPITTNSCLVSALLLNWSSNSILIPDASGKNYHPVSFSSLGNQIKSDIISTLKSRITFLSNGDNNAIIEGFLSANESDFVTLGSSDYFFKDAGGSGGHFVVCFRLTSIGKRIYKILRGLGYGLDFTNSNLVSALPLFAFYKAYFDTYFNTRFVNWHNTLVYRIIQNIYNTGSYPYLNVLHNLISFLNAFQDCLYSSPADYVSIHTANPLNGSSVSGSQSSTPLDDYNIDSLTWNGNILPTLEPDGKVPNLDSSNRLTYYQLQALKRLTKYISKDSVIGGRVIDWFKVHFGVTPSDDMFMPSQFIDEHIINLDIDDLFATADTYNSDNNSGSYLGSYAGRGLGFSKTDHEISFSAKDFGYLIILGSVAPEQIYSCGDSPQLYGTSRYTLPNTDFDAMGYELTPLACIADYSAAPSSVWQNFDNLTSKSFGYIPRYSGFKVQKSVINGDLYLRSTRDGLSSYYLDKLIDTRSASLDADGSFNGSDNFLIPGASTSWSYPTGIPNIGDWNRIFYNRGFPWYHSPRPSSPAPRIDDNFIYQAVFDVKVTNDLKPIRESYDIDDPEENSKASVQAQ